MEGSAVVGDIGQVEEAGHKLPAFKQDKVGAYLEFADLIQRQRGQKNSTEQNKAYFSPIHVQ